MTNVSKTAKISYEEYKILATEDDIARMSKNLKPFWWENIPLIGVLLYAIRMGIKESDIDRGVLRREITKYSIIFVFSGLICFYLLVALLTPWLLYKIYALSIKKAKIKLEQRDI